MSFSLVISSSKPKSGAGACSTGAVETRCVCDENSGGWETKKREELRFLKGDVCVGEEMEKGKEGEERVWEDNKEARRCAGVRAVAIFRRKRTQVKQLFREGLRKRITRGGGRSLGPRRGYEESFVGERYNTRGKRFKVEESFVELLG
jgi:hypothetical protein